ncbi:uncharacterized protein BJ212DRAFT_1298302 [Suillus subaureus]|uniref:Nephrocystin 3-like N-terminal domain-containing protein n=1 Tax=Suillus subaureus TaxID=48587 RepID=A0A9P7EEG2_9AGAM|nr:uncharacterized protein BJ212DRAFT_1298302 [Suillus subaureus]KAG1819006.1 hypothetical protein BJ212DRAFT_1298302 [Suillus subaureus]
MILPAQKARKKDEERRKFLQWMSPVSCDDKHTTCHGQRNPGTARWIFHIDEYKTWNTSDHAFLWLNGQPGHGKTILACFNNLEMTGSPRYANQGGKKKGILLLCETSCSYNAMQSHIPQISVIFESFWLKHPRWFTGQSSWIDALDECKDYPDLVEHLVKPCQRCPTTTFRHWQKAAEDSRRLSGLPETLRTTILNKLSEKAAGMFRWVQCQLDVIMKCKTSGSIQKALDNLPKDLHETYDRILHSIEERGGDDGPISQRCLLLLAGTFTPLTLNQLNEAMMIEVGRPSLNEDLRVLNTMDIVGACGSLVTYNEKTGIVALSHYSVKEYLVSRTNSIFKSISDMHARICELLITYVLCDFVDEICAKLELEDKQKASRLLRADVADVSKDHPLLSYAIQGYKHLGHVSDEDSCVMVALSRLNSEFLRNTKKNRVLAQGQYGYGPRWLPAWVTLPSLLFIPLEHGKPWMVEYLIKQYPHLRDVDIAPDWGSPLIFAMAKNPGCLSILLKPGIDFNKLSSFTPSLYHQFNAWSDSYAPISWAAVTGSEVAVDFLLSQTEVNVPDDIIHMAVRARELSVECIRKFCQHGADVNFMVDSSTPIHYLLTELWRFYDEIQLLSGVKALVEPSCNLSLQDQTARTVLHIALDARLEDIVTYLLEQNAGLSATATVLPDMWSWAKNKMWFPKVQAAALAADQQCTRIEGKVVDATAESKLVEFSVAATADRDNPNPICAVVVSAILADELSDYDVISADFSCYNQSLQKDIQDSLQDDSPILECCFRLSPGQRVSSRLFDYHQGDEVTRMLQQLTEDKDSTCTSLFLQMTKDVSYTEVFELAVEFVLDIYRGYYKRSFIIWNRADIRTLVNCSNSNLKGMCNASSRLSEMRHYQYVKTKRESLNLPDDDGIYPTLYVMSQSASVKAFSCTKVLASRRVTVFFGAAGAKSLSASTSASVVESRLMILAASKASPSKESAFFEPSSDISSGYPCYPPMNFGLGLSTELSTWITGWISMSVDNQVDFHGTLDGVFTGYSKPDY